MNASEYRASASSARQNGHYTLAAALEIEADKLEHPRGAELAELMAAARRAAAEVEQAAESVAARLFTADVPAVWR